MLIVVEQVGHGFSTFLAGEALGCLDVASDILWLLPKHDVRTEPLPRERRGESVRQINPWCHLGSVDKCGIRLDAAGAGRNPGAHVDLLFRPAQKSPFAQARAMKDASGRRKSVKSRDATSHFPMF